MSPLRLLMVVLAAVLLTQPAAASSGKRIALSFDDVPRGAGAFMTPEQRTAMLIAALKRAGVRQAAFFVNPGRMKAGDGSEDRLAAYVRAGHVVANHGFDHLSLSASPVDAYLADIDRAETWLKGRRGYRPWFRFPFLDEGRADKVKRDAVRAALAKRGLQNGYVTADGYDWKLEGLAVAARTAGRQIDEGGLHDLYVDTMVGAAEYADGLARKALGRSPAHVLLLHETDLAALWIGDVVGALRAKGWMVVSADEAYRDPIRTAAPDVPSAQGTRIELMAWERGLPRPRWYERNDEALLTRLFEEQAMQNRQPRP